MHKHMHQRWGNLPLATRNRDISMYLIISQELKKQKEAKESTGRSRKKEYGLYIYNSKQA